MDFTNNIARISGKSVYQDASEFCTSNRLSNRIMGINHEYVDTPLNELKFNDPSLAWPDRFFPYLFVVAEKRVWSGLQTHLVLTPSNVLINCIINTLVYSEKHKMWQTSLASKKYSCVSATICLTADYLIHMGKMRKVSSLINALAI